ncbi:hypothetical protein C8Q79DRAFT_776806 [Trametes meyenii]|nr:hypothetical protein C8Q79DRAFT_776806 [Trametes meyenii]
MRVGLSRRGRPPQRDPDGSLFSLYALALNRWAPRVVSKTARILTSSGSGTLSDEEEEDHPAAPPALDPARALPDVDYHEAARALVRLLAPDLATLALQTERGSLLPNHLRFLDRPLPRVRELTLVALADLHPLLVFPRPNSDSDSPAGDDEDGDGDDEEGAPLLPAVTHLHVGRRRIPSGCLFTRVSSVWPTHAPNATHLRISCVPPPSNYSLSAPSATDYMWAGKLAVPSREPGLGPGMRYLVLQPELELDESEGGGDARARCVVLRHGAGDGEREDDALELHLGQLRSVARAGPHGETLQALVVEPCSLDYRGRRARIRRDEWADRAAGGAGCWAELEDAARVAEEGADVSRS